MNVLQATAQLGDKKWSTDPKAGELEMRYGQGLINDKQVAADFTDENFNRIVISSRIDLTNDENPEGPYSGIADFVGIQKIPVLCEIEWSSGFGSACACRGAGGDLVL